MGRSDPCPSLSPWGPLSFPKVTWGVCSQGHHQHPISDRWEGVSAFPTGPTPGSLQQVREPGGCEGTVSQHPQASAIPAVQPRWTRRCIPAYRRLTESVGGVRAWGLPPAWTRLRGLVWGLTAGKTPGAHAEGLQMSGPAGARRRMPAALLAGHRNVQDGCWGEMGPVGQAGRVDSLPAS